jgi:hypothetical protein
MKKSNNDSDLVYFKGGKVTRLQYKRAMVCLGFGVLGIVFTFFTNKSVTESNTIGKAIVWFFVVAGYLLSTQIFPKKKDK